MYISANENDAIFSNDVLLTAVFDGVYARAKEIFYKVILFYMLTFICSLHAVSAFFIYSHSEIPKDSPQVCSLQVIFLQCNFGCVADWWWSRRQ